MKMLKLSLPIIFVLNTAFCLPPPVPVAIGHDGPDFDACGGVAALKGDKLTVWSGPSKKAYKRDRLEAGQHVWMCDSAGEKGEWTGIVYSKPESKTPCGVSSPVATPRPYNGPCRKGWVKTDKIILIAG